jgi:hypothetical protein
VASEKKAPVTLSYLFSYDTIVSCLELVVFLFLIIRTMLHSGGCVEWMCSSPTKIVQPTSTSVEAGVGAWSLFLVFCFSLARQIPTEKRSSPEMSLRSCNPPVESGYFYQRTKTGCGLRQTGTESGFVVINGQEAYHLKRR